MSLVICVIILSKLSRKCSLISSVASGISTLLACVAGGLVVRMKNRGVGEKDCLPENLAFCFRLLKPQAAQTLSMNHRNITISQEIAL